MKIENLHDLIHKLEPSERRYFQLKAGTYQKKEGSQVFQLYQLLAASPELDETKLRGLLPGEERKGQFHVLKNQLLHQLLENLIHFRGAINPADRISLLLQKSRVLQEKKLYREANRFLKRAAKIAEQYDRFEDLLLIYKDWKRLYAWVLEVDKRAEHIDRFWTMERNVLEKLNNLRTLEWLSMRVFDLYYRIHYARNVAEKMEYDRLMQHPLLEREESALSFSAKVVFLNTHGLYTEAVGQIPECIRYRRSLVALYQSCPERLKQHFSQYLAAYNNYLLVLIHAEKYQEVNRALTELGALPGRHKVRMKTAEQVMWFRAYFSLRLEVCIRQGKFAGALDLMPAVQEQFVQLDEDLNPAFRFPFHYFFAYACFALGRYDEALAQLEPILYQVELRFKQELFRFARLLQLFIHVEKEDFAYLSTLIRSTRRYLRRLGGTYPLEDRLLRFLSKMPFADTRAAFRQFAVELQTTADVLLTPHILHHFDFNVWVQAKIKDLPFADIYQEIRN